MLFFFPFLIVFSHLRALCLTVMKPGCKYNSTYDGFLCKEACEFIKNNICLKEWTEIITRINEGFLNIDNIFPDCEKLPSIKVSKNCLYPEVFKSKWFCCISTRIIDIVGCDQQEGQG